VLWKAAELTDTTLQCRDYYAMQYGVVPGFKASLHSGSVTVGEIGRIKKEIIFTGDTLNTSARIVELCNHYNAELLISENLMEQLKEQKTCLYEKVGELELRGRQQPVTIYKVIQALSSGYVGSNKL
jgi:adenylate cyclase